MELVQAVHPIECGYEFVLRQIVKILGVDKDVRWDQVEEPRAMSCKVDVVGETLGV